MESTATSDIAAALAKAITTPNQRKARLGLTPALVARKNVFERVLFRASFKFASVKLPTNCMFVVAPIAGLRLVSHSKGLYAQGAQSSSVERLRVTLADTGPAAFDLLQSSRLLGSDGLSSD